MVVVALVEVEFPRMFTFPAKVDDPVEMRLATEMTDVVADHPVRGCVQASYADNLEAKVEKSVDERRPVTDADAFWKSVDVATYAGTPPETPTTPLVPMTPVVMLEKRPEVVMVSPLPEPQVRSPDV